MGWGFNVLEYVGGAEGFYQRLYVFLGAAGV